MNGYEVARRLRSEVRPLLRVAVSGYAQAAGLRRAAWSEFIRRRGISGEQ